MKRFLYLIKHIHATCYILCAALLLFCALFATCYTPGVEAGVENTKHNLSTSGPGPIKALSETQVCIFCHTPHSATTTPLWNHTLSQASYTLPSNAMPEWATMLSIPQNPPEGDSKLCLSCHDGTVAIGSVVNLGGAPITISMHDTGTGYLTAGEMLSESAPSYIGTNLSGHHPVSIEVNEGLIHDKGIQCANNEVSFRLCYPRAQDPIRLRPTDNRYGTGPSSGIGVQCSSCHDAHDNTNGYFLRVPYGGTIWDIDTYPLCNKCHVVCSSGCP